MPIHAGIHGIARVLAAGALLSVALQGCVAVRYADYAMPGLRFDRPGNAPLPGAASPEAQAALAAWSEADGEARAQRPTPYHWYVDTPAPGTFEGDAAVAIAFSGGGMRGILFSAACVREIAALGAIVAETPDGPRRVDVLDEADYVAGVSTGAIPAALFALDAGGRAPEAFRRAHWPEALNLNPTRRYLGAHLPRADRLLRDFSVDMNTRPTMAATLSRMYFGAGPGGDRRGLRFADLPETPVLLVSAALINPPGAPFIQTRLPYRYATGAGGPLAWSVDDQTFETFGTDPMRYPLGEACYNSLAFPGFTRSGLLRAHPDQDWVHEGLDGASEARMRRARQQPGIEGVYSLMDGGLGDNRGIQPLARIFMNLPEGRRAARPLIVALDAGVADLETAASGRRGLHKGWLREVRAATSASWSMGQHAMNQWMESLAADGHFDLAMFRFSAWAPYLGAPPGDADPDYWAAREKLEALCREEPLVGGPERLLAISRGIGTAFVQKDDEQVAAIRVAARFAVWHAREELLAWAAEAFGGPARFEGLNG